MATLTEIFYRNGKKCSITVGGDDSTHVMFNTNNKGHLIIKLHQMTPEVKEEFDRHSWDYIWVKDINEHKFYGGLKLQD